MASPFVRTDENGRILFDSDKTDSDLSRYLEGLRNGIIAAPPTVDQTHPDLTLPGSLGTETGDVIAVELVAGQTYTFAYRGTVEGGIEDPLLALFAPDDTLIAQDDDGGLGRSSQITYTATTSGTYQLLATSWYHVDPTAPGYPDYRDAGDYTINIWSPDPAHDAPATRAEAVEIDVGTTYGYLDVAGDRDMYQIELTEGMVYTFAYNGGISGSADWDGEAGENIGIIRLYDADGNALASAVNYETGIGFFAEEGGTYYVRVEGYQAPMTGGYTLDVGEIDPSTRDPLESLVWDSAANVPFVDTDSDGVGDTAYVYFAPAGENFGEFEPDGVTPMTTYGWEDFQIEGVMRALEEYENILGVNYVITDDAEQATFRMLTTENQAYGARFYPQDPSYGTQQGIGTFNLISGRFTDPASLQPGGFSYAVVLHEFGHAHGIAHPHDTGGGSEVMLGVTGSDSLGIYDLNQGVYTVMSYNDAWITHPDGERVFAGSTFQSGWSETLGAFDIAVLQQRYGIINPHNTGNTVYELADNQDDASYQTIWDTGGTDEISYSGARNARIDLLAATLDYTPTGGGVVSFIDDIWGGYTIANGVVIENASGGEGDDGILGNDAVNVLSGNGGDDILVGRGGGDTLDGGAGFDTASYVDADSGVSASLASRRGTGGDAAGDRYIDIEALTGSNFADTLSGGNADDTLSGLGGNDLLTGGNGNDTLDGGDGDDRLEGGNSSDVLNGGAGNDLLEGGNSSDELNGGDGNDLLDGGNSSDVLNGGAGDDLLDGGNSADVLNGGAGDDILDGGNSRDTYVFEDAGSDTIVDYERGEKIDLTGLVGVGSGDVTLTDDAIFVDLVGADDLTIFIEGASVRMDDILFAPPAALGGGNAADSHLAVIV